MVPLIAVELRREPDVVLARQRARQVAGLMGFDAQDQSRITTAVSEIARNAFEYAGSGRVEFQIATDPTRALIVTVTDRGPGIAELEEVLSGAYRSKTGMGVGLIGAKRLMDRLDIRSGRGAGTVVTMTKELTTRGKLPTQRIDPAAISAKLAKSPAVSPFDEIQRQNQELVQLLEELQLRQAELAELNRELAETNQGVIALYAELDDKAQQLERASELKTRFLSAISHELRTPLNSIIGLAGILIDRLDGPLTEEQERQITLIRRSAETLSEQVNDLLDTARIESGKVTITPQEFTILDLFGSLRGMFRPLALRETVRLEFDDEGAAQIRPLDTDEGKVAQILRNFLSNALKFTESGTIRVSAATGLGGEWVTISVSDEGIGIAPGDQMTIFEDFGQIESSIQRRVKGTGLGLPLTRRLAALLGGAVEMESEPGVGSTFRVLLPIRYDPGVSIDRAEGDARG